MAMYTTGMMVVRLRPGSYDLTATNRVIKDFNINVSVASTSDGEGYAEVIYADEDGALVAYKQAGSYRDRGLLGHLYYPNKFLEPVKRPEEVINDYAIY